MNEETATEDEHKSEGTVSEPPPGLVPRYWFLIAGIMAGFCVYSFVLNNQFHSELPKWKTLLEDELGIATPKVASTVESIGTAGFGIASAFLLLWWLVPAWIRFRPLETQAKKFAWLIIGFILTSTVYTFITAATGELQKTYAKAWYDELPKTKNKFSMRSPSFLLEDFQDKSKPEQERITAAVRMRAWGLLLQAKLIDDIDEDVAPALQKYASNEENPIKLRFFAVHALVTIDRDSTESQRAIVMTVRDCLNSDDEELRNMAESYKSLPFFSDVR